MTVLEDVEDLIIRQAPRGYCDDCIASMLEITPRQHANHKTRELAKLPKFDCRKDTCNSCRSAKLVIRYTHRT